MENLRYITNRYFNQTFAEDYSGQIERMSGRIGEMTGKKINGHVRTITMQVTDNCNLYCTYCYQINKGKNRMSLETGKKFIDILLTDDTKINNYINRYNSDVVVLDFIGGEPLLEIDLIDQLTDYFINRMIELDHPWLPYYKISIGTNGTLYFNPKVQEYIHKHVSKLSINITVDGNRKLHDTCRLFADGSGSYDLAIAANEDWHRLSGTLNPSSKLTIAPENVDFLSEATINMIEVGFKIINENCVFEEGWTLEDAKKLYSELKIIADYVNDNDLEDKVVIRLFTPDWYHPISPVDNNNWCGGNGQMLAVNPSGNMYNCLRFMESSIGDKIKPLIIGHVDRGIEITEDDKQNLKCMQCITRRSQSTDECFNCTVGAGCGWCTGYNYQKFGTCDKRATFICDMHRAASLATVYFWNKILDKHQDVDKDGKRIRYPMYCKKEHAVPIIGEEEYEMLKNISVESW